LKALAPCIVSVFLFCIAASLSAQTTTRTRIHVPEDPNASLLADAQAALDRKDFDAAIAKYREYLEKKPDDALAHFQLGYAYTALQRSADAKTEYEKAVSLKPDMSEAQLNLGITLLDSDPNAAIAPLQKAAELLPEQARPKFLLALALERSGKPARAIEQYQASEKLDGQDFNTRFALGRLLLDSQRAADAEREFREAILLRQDSAPAHLGLAQSLYKEKKAEAAAAEYASYLARQPDDGNARLERASALVDIDKDDEALAELDRAAAAGPESLRALQLRSLVYFRKKEYDQAIAVLQRAAQMAPQDADIPARLGHLYLERKDYPSAVRQLIAAFKMNPSANDILGDLITAQYLNKNYPAALQGLDLLGERQTLPVGSWFVRATCYDKLGRPAEALEAYKKFLQLNKDENSDMYFEAAARARFLTRELQEKKK
jgi:protein O-GlcNAc transferase